MIIIQVCMGTACYLKGANNIIKHLQKLISQYKLEDSIELKGSFCLRHCSDGVSVRIIGEEKIYSIKDKNINQFFKNKIISKMH